MESPRHKVEHPCEPCLHLYFMCDTPHLIKCIRNHLLRHQYGVLFSHSTSCGLKAYQRLKYPGLEDCGGTVEFTKRRNDVFDALNVNLPSRGIKEESKEIKIITDFLELVDETEHNHNTRGTVMFASPVTTQSLRVTLASVRDLISDLLRTGAHYVLTGKLNQDPLERFFVMVRSFSGDEDHPTVVSFTQIYRLLSLYVPIKACIQGNVTEEPTHVLATMEKTMKLKKQHHASAHEKLKDIINRKLALICEGAKGQGGSDRPSTSHSCNPSGDSNASTVLSKRFMYEIRGCAFPFAKAINARRDELGLKTLCRDNPAVYAWFTRVRHLPFVPDAFRLEFASDLLTYKPSL
ncbi:hypothetical protein HPB47_015547 [Ixodes persulcatus]|uniref:Uncharacterized protein n=1 Tax=Ixodes persulcatus TaxID=34615 RepID=A0AC60QTB7_IXOPE|nr:hypothetical protein HPB47_015547 [Ixodes persulcatus]